MVVIMKKILCFIVICLSLIFTLSCSKEDSKVTIITPYGIPFISVARLTNDKSVSIEAVSGAEHLQSALSSASYDIVIAPINLGANLYNAGKSNYKIASVITSNNAYIVSRVEDPLNSIDDLIDKEIMAFGKNGIPGSLIRKLYQDNDFLDINNLDNNFFDSSASVYGMFKGSDTIKYALMSEPEITKLKIKDNINVNTLDLCSLLNIKFVPQACIFVKEKSDRIDNVLKKIEENINYLNLNNSKYSQEIISIDKSLTSMGLDVLTESMAKANICYKEASSCKSDIENILLILNCKAVLPNEGFYY
jgi:hypothetical protein